MMKVTDKWIIEKLKFVKTIYIFDYGSPLCKISIREDHIEVISLSEEKKLIQGASVVARLLHLLAQRGSKNILSLADDNLIVHFGKHYIIAAVPSRKHYIPVIPGFLRRLNRYLDNCGLMPIDELEKCVIKFLEKS